MDEGAYPDGVFDFKELVSSQYHFVDKTLLIRDIANIRNKTFVYTRSRCFGKSINLSMLDYFFNVRYKDDPNIFEGSEKHPPVIVEVKTTVDPKKKLERLAIEALKKIDLKCYSKEPETIDSICVGIAIRQKTVEVKFG